MAQRQFATVSGGAAERLSGTGDQRVKTNQTTYSQDSRPSMIVQKTELCRDQPITIASALPKPQKPIPAFAERLSFMVCPLPAPVPFSGR